MSTGQVVADVDFSQVGKTPMVWQDVPMGNVDAAEQLALGIYARAGLDPECPAAANTLCRALYGHHVHLCPLDKLCHSGI